MCIHTSRSPPYKKCIYKPTQQWCGYHDPTRFHKYRNPHHCNPAPPPLNWSGHTQSDMHLLATKIDTLSQEITDLTCTIIKLTTEIQLAVDDSDVYKINTSHTTRTLSAQVQIAHTRMEAMNKLLRGCNAQTSTNLKTLAAKPSKKF